MVPLGTVGLCACKLLDKYYLGACYCTMASKKLDYQSKQEKAKEGKSSPEIVISKKRLIILSLFIYLLFLLSNFIIYYSPFQSNGLFILHYK